MSGNYDDWKTTPPEDEAGRCACRHSLDDHECQGEDGAELVCAMPGCDCLKFRPITDADIKAEKEERSYEHFRENG